jgi:uncharacterized membrane protein YeaQ/YmgE (transglycosylase-associated protein family)
LGNKLASRKRRNERVGIISWIVVGLIAGALGKLIMPGDAPGGIIVTILIGMAGALVGGFVVRLLGGSGATGFNIWSILVATLGAIILSQGSVLIFGAFLPKRAIRELLGVRHNAKKV